MKKNEIKVGGHYVAKVSNNLVTVRVDKIREVTKSTRSHISPYTNYTTTTVYDVTNLTTGRKTTFKSAAKFRSVAKVEAEQRPDPTAARRTPVTALSTSATPSPASSTANETNGLPSSEGDDRRPFAPYHQCSCPQPEPRWQGFQRLCLKCGGEYASGGTTSPNGTQPDKVKASDSATGSVSATPASPPAGSAPSSLSSLFAARKSPASGRQPTEEQAAILAAVAEGFDVLVVEAGAGTGKTTTLRMLVDVLPGNGQYTAFNKSLVTDSKAKFAGTRCECNTSHALAFRAEGKRFAHRLNANRVRSEQVANMLGIQPMMFPCGDKPKTLAGGFLAAQVMGAIRRFCQSADQEITADHFKYLDGIDNPSPDGGRTYANNEAVRDYLLPFARRAWTDLCDEQGQLPFAHDHYVKIWQLNNPIIAADYILLDESQDSAPVLLDIVKQQVARGTPVILVGDANQIIYEWRGCVNAAEAFPNAPRRYLSQSFRFGPAVAELANKVLSGLERPTQLRLKGLPSIPSRIVKHAPEDGQEREVDCVLTRTNAAAIATLLGAIAKGKRPFLVGGGSDVTAFVEAAYDLQQGKSTSHPDLACFNSWDEVVIYSTLDEGEDLRLMVKLLTEFGCKAILDALRSMPQEQDADICISTAHKSKGREWDRVQLAGDFPARDKSDDSDLRLLYVAVTRAKLELDVSRCPFFTGKDGMKVEDVIASQPKPEPKSILSHAPANRPPAGIYTWNKRDGKWCVRGPKADVGTEVTVQRADGSKQLKTLRKVVAEYPEATIYEV